MIGMLIPRHRTKQTQIGDAKPLLKFIGMSPQYRYIILSCSHLYDAFNLSHVSLLFRSQN